jgi:hypothetical protein
MDRDSLGSEKQAMHLVPDRLLVTIPVGTGTLTVSTGTYIFNVLLTFYYRHNNAKYRKPVRVEKIGNSLGRNTLAEKRMRALLLIYTGQFSCISNSSSNMIYIACFKY